MKRHVWKKQKKMFKNREKSPFRENYLPSECLQIIPNPTSSHKALGLIAFPTCVSKYYSLIEEGHIKRHKQASRLAKMLKRSLRSRWKVVKSTTTTDPTIAPQSPPNPPVEPSSERMGSKNGSNNRRYTKSKRLFLNEKLIFFKKSKRNELKICFLVDVRIYIRKKEVFANRIFSAFTKKT